jgi:K+-transporting ATPase ATPase C chain
MKHLIRPAVFSLLLLTVLTGIVYPLCITGLAQLLFPHEANGSLIFREGHPAGSALIGQPFEDPRFFWGRPSATKPFSYNSAASAGDCPGRLRAGSNLGPSNPELTKALRSRIAALHAADPDNRRPIPVDLVTASGSGLDPHISPAAALYQVRRVAKARGLEEGVVQGLVMAHLRDRDFGILGEAVVPVLELNMALETLR